METPNTLLLAGATATAPSGYYITEVHSDGFTANFAGESTTAPRATAGTYSATDGACLESAEYKIEGAWSAVYNHSTGANLRLVVSKVGV